MKASKSRLAVLALALLGAACGTAGRKDDPLRNTKKLVVEGHRSLYRNGAFRVPRTEISLIPAGPSAMDLAFQLMGVRARQSLELSLKRAAQSVTVVAEGTKLTFRAAKGVRRAGGAGADAIRGMAKEGSTLLLDRSSGLGRELVGKSWTFARGSLKAAADADAAIAAGSRSAGDELAARASEQGAGIVRDTRAAAADVSREGLAKSRAAFARAGGRFVTGYAAVPANMRRAAKAVGDDLQTADFGGAFARANESRSRASGRTVDLMAETVRGYPGAIGESFEKAGREFSGSYRTTGVSLAVLKSLRWAVQGVVGDGVVVPAAKLGAASLGYVAVNFLAFPTMVVAREGAATAELAVEVGWDAARAGYDLTAPTGAAALAGVYGLAAGLGSQSAAGALAGGGAAAGYGEAALGRAAGVAIKGAGAAAGAGVHYIGVPLASAGISVGGGAIGAAVGAVGAVSGGTVRVAGETGAAATRGFGNVIAGTALAAGTAGSAAAGTSYGVYELSKAVIVPPGYELAGGIVLDYGTMTHLAAHTVLAAADCSYLVLSLEGPRWVLYAVKGKTGDGSELPPGAVVDLKAMREAGEEVYAVPASDAEMKALVDAAYENLPELPAPASGN